MKELIDKTKQNTWMAQSTLPMEVRGLSGLDYSDIDSADLPMVYYISDIHLTQHWKSYAEKNFKYQWKQLQSLCPKNILDFIVNTKQFKEWLRQFVEDMFPYAFFDDIINQHKRCTFPIIILFLGDIADNFQWEEAFYKTFLSVWDELIKKHAQKLKNELTEYEDKLTSLNTELKKLEKDLRKARREHEHAIAFDIKTDILDKEKEINAITSLPEYYNPLSTLHRLTDKDIKSNISIISVLGNHEIYQFPSYEECFSAYDSLFKSLGITFLNETTNPIINRNIAGQILIAGTCGSGELNPAKLEKISQKTYAKALSTAKASNSILIFCSHFPIKEWLGEIPSDGNVVYFYGHTHRNHTKYIGNNSFIFADNQIGYKNTVHKLRKAFIWPRINPFADYDDGLHQISLDDYILFSHFIQQYFQTNAIQKYIYRNRCTLYLAKSKDYYGFFLISGKKTYICNGGAVRKMPNSVREYNLYETFCTAVQAYLSVFSKFRLFLEQIANNVKSFGGRGTIHGTIIDIDTYNHIMINPVTGEFTYYNSPIFGCVKEYDDLESLLKRHLPDLLNKYQTAFNTTKITTFNKNDEHPKTNSALHAVPIGKDSAYGASRYMAPIQRIFSSHVLRAYDINVIKKAQQNIDNLPGINCLPDIK